MNKLDAKDKLFVAVGERVEVKNFRTLLESFQAIIFRRKIAKLLKVYLKVPGLRELQFSSKLFKGAKQSGSLPALEKCCQDAGSF